MKPQFYIPFFAVLIGLFLLLLRIVDPTGYVAGILNLIFGSIFGLIGWVVLFVLINVSALFIGFFMPKGIDALGTKLSNRGQDGFKFSVFQHVLTAAVFGGIIWLTWMLVLPLIRSIPYTEGFFNMFVTDGLTVQALSKWGGVAMIEFWLSYWFYMSQVRSA